jgi:alanyl-tRNA synthetase
MRRPFAGDEIRETFLRFFMERQHARIGSASIIPANDPTLLFVNAGMAPLKPYFLGEALPPAPDLCNVQPCVRTVDIGDVGDRHHLTFFEMLGSWSSGHYFKDRAVELAFELLTQGFGFGVADLYMTVFRGDDTLGVAPDDVSAAAWERVGVPRDHIVFLGAEDNFWSAGDTGPCGPCTEVFCRADRRRPHPGLDRHPERGRPPHRRHRGSRGRRAAAPGDHAQSLRNAPAACGPAPGSGRACPAGWIAGGPRPAALRFPVPASSPGSGPRSATWAALGNI